MSEVVKNIEVELEELFYTRTQEEHQRKHEAQAKKAFELQESLHKLLENEDFQKVILDGFLITEASNQARNSVNVNLPEELREAALGTAQAAGYLKQYLVAIDMNANSLRSSIARSMEESGE